MTLLVDFKLPWTCNSDSWMYIIPCRKQNMLFRWKCMERGIDTLSRSSMNDAINSWSSFKLSFSNTSNKLPFAQYSLQTRMQFDSRIMPRKLFTLSWRRFRILVHNTLRLLFNKKTFGHIFHLYLCSTTYFFDFPRVSNGFYGNYRPLVHGHSAGVVADAANAQLSRFLTHHC